MTSRSIVNILSSTTGAQVLNQQNLWGLIPKMNEWSTQRVVPVINTSLKHRLPPQVKPCEGAATVCITFPFRTVNRNCTDEHLTLHSRFMYTVHDSSTTWTEYSRPTQSSVSRRFCFSPEEGLNCGLRARYKIYSEKKRNTPQQMSVHRKHYLNGPICFLHFIHFLKVVLIAVLGFKPTTIWLQGKFPDH